MKLGSRVPWVHDPVFAQEIGNFKKMLQKGRAHCS